MIDLTPFSLLSLYNAKDIHFKAIRIFTENGDKATKPMAYLWACARVHAYHGDFFFSRGLFMGRKVRNADWHLWVLHALNRYEKHDSGFCIAPYCFIRIKLVPLLP